jgi:hypothetical protein
MREMQPEKNVELTMGKMNAGCAKCDKLLFFQYFSSALYIISMISLLIVYSTGSHVLEDTPESAPEVAPSVHSLVYSIVSIGIFCLPIFSFIGGLILCHIKLF